MKSKLFISDPVVAPQEPTTLPKPQIPEAPTAPEKPEKPIYDPFAPVSPDPDVLPAPKA